MCGKNSRSASTSRRQYGSPPRVREELIFSLLFFLPIRITPACAGRTSMKLNCLAVTWDHPRVCGKNLVVIVVCCIMAGSPPRVREEPIFPSLVMLLRGITPACAGRTVKKSPFYAFSFSSLFMNPFTFVTSSLKISTFVLLCCSVLSPIP